MVSHGLRKPRKNLMRNLTYILTLIVLVGCSGEQSTGLDEDVLKEKKYNWRLVTSWPKNYPGLGMAPERIADLVEECPLLISSTRSAILSGAMPRPG